MLRASHPSACAITPRGREALSRGGTPRRGVAPRLSRLGRDALGRRGHRDRGLRGGLRWRARRAQAMVESAIVIPLMTFMILGVLQLAMVQHARIMTEYAAFNAARAGIVWNADPWIMENAAIISLLPTYEGLLEESDIGNPKQMVKRIVMRALLYQINRRLPQAVDMVRNGTDGIIGQLPGSLQGPIGGIRDSLLNKAESMADAKLQGMIKGALGGNDRRMVQVHILNPRLSDIPLREPEIQFDSVREGERWRRKTRLSIQVRYLYMMRIPFANWIIHRAWQAQRAGVRLYGAVYNPSSSASDSSMFAKHSQKPDLSGQPTNLEQDIYEMANDLDDPVYLVPLRAQYTMRMQSNPYRVSLMQQGPPDD